MRSIKKAGGATPPAPKRPLAVRKRTVPDTRATKYQPIWAMCANSLRVLFAFGQTGSGLPEDLNGDNTVDDADLLTVLFNFGSGCE